MHMVLSIAALRQKKISNYRLTYYYVCIGFIRLSLRFLTTLYEERKEEIFEFNGVHPRNIRNSVLYKCTYFVYTFI